MFFDQHDEGNAMVESNLIFQELSHTVLAGLGTGLASTNRVSITETLFLRPGSKWVDPNIFSDDRNIQFIILIT